MPLSKVKSLIGTVVSHKMTKTAVVAVEVIKRPPLYRKSFRRTKKYKAHDEANQCQQGDRVRIAEGRPLSKEKRWRVVEILARGEKRALVEGVGVEEVLADEMEVRGSQIEESAAEGRGE